MNDTTVADVVEMLERTTENIAASRDLASSSLLDEVRALRGAVGSLTTAVKLLLELKVEHAGRLQDPADVPLINRLRFTADDREDTIAAEMIDGKIRVEIGHDDGSATYVFVEEVQAP